MLVFSYGSNMSSKRLEARIGKVAFISVAQLHSHQLRLHKESTDRSAKADAYFTGNEKDWIWGVLHHLQPQQKAILDRFENLGVSYHEKKVKVRTPAGQDYHTHLYIASERFINPDVKPYEWYMKFLVEGALEHQFPPHYVDHLKAIPFITDSDSQRRNTHFKIIT